MPTTTSEAPGLALAEASSFASTKAPERSPFEAGLDEISLQIHHDFARAAARERVEQLLDFWRTAYGVASEWRGDRVVMRGRVHGVSIDASFNVADRSVIAVAKDPGWPWRAKAESYVGWMLRKYLHPNYEPPPGGW